MRHPILLPLIIIFSTLCADLPSSNAATTSTPTKKSRSREAAMIRSVAEIIELDTRTRTVTIKRDNGNTVRLIAASAVRNFSQLNIGDFVVAQYGRATAIAMRKPGTNAPARTQAKRGANANLRHIVGDLIAIDDKKGHATLKATNDQVVDISVTDRKMLKSVKIGDQVKLDYNEATLYSIKQARSKRKP